MKRVAISTAIGACAGLALWGAYLGAPYAGLTLTPTTLLVSAAIVAFGSSVALLSLSAFAKPEGTAPKPWRRISHLGMDDYKHFPRGGVRLTLRPDTAIGELDIVRHPKSYVSKNILLTIKKGKTLFNPIVLSQLFKALSEFAGFEHILLVNEHDEFIGYIPAMRARLYWRGPESEAAITKYIIRVLEDPEENSGVLREIDALGVKAKVSDSILVTDALKLLSESLFRGLIVFRGERNRKPIGVIYEDELFRASIKRDD